MLLHAYLTDLINYLDALHRLVAGGTLRTSATLHAGLAHLWLDVW